MFEDGYFRCTVREIYEEKPKQLVRVRVYHPDMLISVRDKHAWCEAAYLAGV